MLHLIITRDAIPRCSKTKTRVVQIGRRMDISKSVDNLYIVLKILYFAILIFGSRIHEILHTVTCILIKRSGGRHRVYISGAVVCRHQGKSSSIEINDIEVAMA